VTCPIGSLFLPPTFKKIIHFKTLADGLAFQTFHTFVAPRLETDKDVSFHEQLHTKRISCVTVCKNGEFIATGKI
jgi:hypothetical protein